MDLGFLILIGEGLFCHTESAFPPPPYLLSLMCTPPRPSVGVAMQRGFFRKKFFVYQSTKGLFVSYDDVCVPNVRGFFLAFKKVFRKRPKIEQTKHLFAKEL